MEIFGVVVFGAIFGSFISAASWRLPREENLVSESSKCRSCKADLKTRDLVPIFSWLFSRGKCRHCGVGIGKRYILCELLTVATFLLNYFIYGLSPEFFVITLFCIGMLILIISDFETYIIPDTSVVLMAIAAISHAILFDKDISGLVLAAVIAVLGSLAVRQIFIWVMKKDPLGFGDVKLFAVAGLWLGSFMLPFYLILSGVLGIVTGAVWQKLFKQEVFPFGPAMAVSLYIMIVFYNEIASLLLLK